MTIKNRISQILSRIIGTKFFFILLSVSICFVSCNESSIVGLDVQPSNELLNVAYQDTTTILTRTLKMDSLTTDESIITSSVGLIGKYVDPVFGTASASLYTQVRLTTNIGSNTFGTNPICDSILLSLVYEGTVYGKKDFKQQKINVYELTEGLSKSNTYYSNSTLLSKSPTDLTAAIGGYVFSPKPNDSVNIGGKNTPPHLRVLLDNTFGQQLLNNQSTGNIATNDAFQNFFKGMHITTENTTGLSVNEGNILSFKMKESTIALHYHYTGRTVDNKNDSTIYTTYFFWLNDVARFNHFDHDFSGALTDLNNQLNNPSQTNNNTVYIQSIGGTKIKVDFPYIMNWQASGPLAVNKAELIINVDDSNPIYELNTYEPPESISILGIKDDGTTYLIPDISEFYYVNTYYSDTKQYRINIQRYIQQILNGELKNNGLYVVANYRFIGKNIGLSTNRAVIGGGGSGSSKPMKLNLTFTKLN